MLFLLIAGRSMCQPVQIGQDNALELLGSKLSILPDRVYTIDKILKDTTLLFLAAPDSVSQDRIYWLKINVDNPNPSARNYVMSISPQLGNILYYFNKDNEKWLESRSDALNNTGSRLHGRHLINIAGKQTTFFFAKIDLTGFGEADKRVKLSVLFQPEAKVFQHEQHIRIAWVCCMIVLLIFMLNNLYLYFSFRDDTVLYYLITQLGGMVYITGYRWILYQFFRVPVFNIYIQGKIRIYDLNIVIVHLSILVTLFGFIGITRMFLNTKSHLPRIDKMLRYSIGLYTILTISLITLNILGYDLEQYTLLYDNLLCALLILFNLFVGISAYARKLPFAETFLLANGIPLLFMLAIPLSHLIISIQNAENLWIPELVVLTQTLALSIALVARTKVIQGALSAAKIDNKQLEFNLKETGYKVQLNQLEIAKMNADIDSEKARYELLKERLEINQRELASSTLYMIQKNELLNHLKSQMQILSRPNPSTSQGIREMSSLIENSTQLDSDWKKFKIHFEQVHPNFFEELNIKHPQLTLKETRLFAYFHMKLSHKEIAALLDIDPASVRRAKTRLFKKMAIPEPE